MTGVELQAAPGSFVIVERLDQGDVIDNAWRIPTPYTLMVAAGSCDIDGAPLEAPGFMEIADRTVVLEGLEDGTLVLLVLEEAVEVLGDTPLATSITAGRHMGKRRRPVLLTAESSRTVTLATVTTLAQGLEAV